MGQDFIDFAVWGAASFTSSVKGAGLESPSIQRLNPGNLPLMDFRDPDRDGVRGIVHINVPNIGVESRQHVLDELAGAGIEAQDQVGGHSCGSDVAA